MQPLTQQDLWPLSIYDGLRDEFRRTVIAAKQHRRVAAGPFMTFVFENRLTVKFQVQEVLRIEKISKPEGVQEELDGFNEMLPRAGELSATLLIELTGADAEVKAQLAKLSGLGQHVFLELSGVRLPALFDEGRDDGQRVSAVQYVRFPLGGHGAALADSKATAALVIDHPAYAHRTELPLDARRSLAADLEG